MTVGGLYKIKYFDFKLILTNKICSNTGNTREHL